MYLSLYARKALESKGFTVTYEDDEENFIRLLQDPRFHVCWLISSDALDWNIRDNDGGVEKWRRLADACERFHRSGRGIYIFADNEPFYDHANVVLQRIAGGAELKGSTPGQKNMTELSNSRHSGVPAGYFKPHLITSGLNTLYEGHTICYPCKQGSLATLATSSDGKPALLCYNDEKGHNGRIVVDTGFTKLWTEWDKAGTLKK